MKLPDVNLLLYAFDEISPHNETARAWLDATLSGSETVALAWPVLIGFLRLSTHANIFQTPLEVAEALDIIDGWLAQPCTTIVSPSARHAIVLRELLGKLGSAGNLVNDAHLAALAIEHGAVVYSCDNDFSRFRGVHWVDPLNP